MRAGVGGDAVSVLGRFGSWLSKTLAFGSLLNAPQGERARRYIANAAAVAKAKASEAIREAAEQGRAVPGAFGNSLPKRGRFYGMKLARRCARAYQKSKQMRVIRDEKTGASWMAYVYKLRVRGY